MRAVTTSGRWIWGLAGLITTVALVIPGTKLITSAGVHGQDAQPQSTATRTVTVPQPVTSLAVQSYGAPVLVMARPVRRVQITETFLYDAQPGGSSAEPQSVKPHSAVAQAGGSSVKPQSAPGGPLSGPPEVVQSVSGGHLSLSAPACALSDCSVSFAVTVPPGLTVTAVTGGGPVTVSGIAGANLDSGGGPVHATMIGGPLTVSTEGGSLMLAGLAGPLRADTGGGPLSAQGLASATATFITGGGDAWVAFSAAPDTVSVSTDGGPATLTVPGGPYALTTDTGGSPQLVAIATDPAAGRSITVSTGGAPLQIEPSASR